MLDNDNNVSQDCSGLNRLVALHTGDPQVSDAGASRGIHARQDVAGACRLRRGGEARDIASASGRAYRMAYRGYGLPIGEMVSEGNVGLMQAVKRFDPDKGFRLSTYAMWWIRASIQEYILRSWSLVKMGTTAAQKKLFFNLRRTKIQLQVLDEGDLKPGHVKEISQKLGVPEEDVVNMNRRLGGDASLSAPIRADSESGEWQDLLVDHTPTQEERLVEDEELERRKSYLSNALFSLNERERRIFEARLLTDSPVTLEVLSAEFGVSRERIRQIEGRAFEKVQKAVQSSTRIMKLGRTQ
jgi:RNA polymerase sigma-32 factor